MNWGISGIILEVVKQTNKQQFISINIAKKDSKWYDSFLLSKNLSNEGELTNNRVVWKSQQ